MPHKAVTPQHWFKAWRSSTRPAPDTDPADLGTAFGLDLSLHENPPAALNPTARPGWVRRLTMRRRATA